MKESISCILGIILSAIAFFAPIDPKSNSHIKIIAFLLFSVIWIIFTLNADKICNFIYRLCGRDTKKRNLEVLKNEFKAITENAMLLEETITQNQEFSKMTLFKKRNFYDLWSTTIEIIYTNFMHGESINSDIISIGFDGTYSRTRKVKLQLMQSIIEVLDVFCNKLKTDNTFVVQLDDFSHYGELLNKIKHVYNI